MIVLVWIFSALISIPPLLGWKDEVDLEWFWKILNERENRTQMEFLQDIEESGRLDLNNFTQTLETVVYPQCLVSQFLIFTIFSIDVEIGAHTGAKEEFLHTVYAPFYGTPSVYA